MKVYEIIHEMAWVDKFDQIEQLARRENMTIDDLFTYLEQTFNLVADTDTNHNLPPLSVGRAGMSDEPITAQSGTNVPEEAIGKYYLKVTFGPGVGPDTPAEEIADLFQVLRHELGHLQQNLARSKEYWPPYIQAAPPSAGVFNLQSALYALQARERSEQAVAAANALVLLGVTAEQFEQAINRVYKGIQDHPGPALEQRELRGMTRRELVRMSGLSNWEQYEKHVNENALQVASARVQAHMGQMALLRAVATNLQGKEAKHQRRRIRGQYHQYMKLLKARYPKVKGYYKTHEKGHLEGMRRTRATRAEIQAEVDHQRAMAEIYNAIRADVLGNKPAA